MTSEQFILEHYQHQAELYGLDPASTMLDLTTREMEVESILRCVDHALNGSDGSESLLDVGCGNGYLLTVLRERFPSLRLAGVDYSEAMLELASRRNIANCEVRRDDVRSLGFADQTFNVVVTERCLINLLNAPDQEKALREIHRILRPGGYAILVESFMDGLVNLNKARAELGLDEVPVPPFNQYFDKDWFLAAVRGLMQMVNGEGASRDSLPPRNFLSTHYFVSRVLYPAITKSEVTYNTEFVKFFRLLPTQGDYSPIQLFYLRKSG